MRNYFCAALLLLGCSACHNEPDPNAGSAGHGPASGAEAPSATPVELWRATPSLVDERIESVATLVANESVEVTARVSGKVTAVHFEDGDRVAAGQLLVELDAAEPTARVREVEATLREARLQLERLGSLGADISTRSAIDVAQATVAAEEARLAQARASLADHSLRAPFAGVLGFRQVSVGALVTPGTVVTELDDISQLKMDFTIPEVHLSRMQVGDKVVGTSPAWPGETFEATVRSIGSRVDPVTRAVTVRSVLANPGLRLRPGMLITVDLVVGQQQALVLPEQALIQKGTESWVYSVDHQSRAFVQPVEIGHRVAGGVVIVEGLALDQPVITRGQSTVRPGMPVREVAVFGQSPDEAAEHAAAGAGA